MGPAGMENPVERSEECTVRGRSGRGGHGVWLTSYANGGTGLFRRRYVERGGGRRSTGWGGTLGCG